MAEREGMDREKKKMGREGDKEGKDRRRGRKGAGQDEREGDRRSRIRVLPN